MRAIFDVCRLSGTAAAPPSKSMGHRLIIGAALADGESVIRGVEYSNDITATISCARALGADVVCEGDTVRVNGGGFLSVKNAVLDCGESGSTLRFFIPLCMSGSDREYTFLGSERLLSRPMSVYESLAHERGIKFEKNNGCIKVSGDLGGGSFTVEGGVSSQFITGLTLALIVRAKSGERGEITIVPPVESRPYIDMTVAALRKFGACVTFIGNCIKVEPCELHPIECRVEGDWSNAAFLDVYNHIGGDVTVTGLDETSTQGDRAYREYFDMLDGGSPTIDVSDTPDLAPVLFALAAAKNGAHFTGTKRLAAKESDRAAVMAHELAKFGAHVDVYENDAVVHKCALHAPTSVIERHRDHRIVMACSTLLTLTGGAIDGAEDVNKSFPSYFDVIKKLGAEVRLEK